MKYLPGRKAAEILGLHQSTLRKYANENKIDYIKTTSGQRRYNIESYLNDFNKNIIVCYCRVSSAKQKDDLQSQIDYMQGKYPNAEIITDIGGGLNWKRKGLNTILERLHQGDKLTLVVAHKDRLARFGFELLQQLVERNGGEIVVCNDETFSPEQELTEDILAILHVFSCRLYGLRRYKNAIEEDKNLSQ